MPEKSYRRALQMTLCALIMLLFAGAEDMQPIAPSSSEVMLARLGESIIYAGEHQLPAGQSVHFSKEELLVGNLLYVSVHAPVPADAPVQQARNVRKMVGLYVPAAQDVSLAEEAIYALCDLCAENPLIKTWITDGMRAPSQQHALQDATFEAYRSTMTTQDALRAARQDVPDSGKSEHQLATSFDVKFTGALDWSRTDPLERSPDGIWLQENAWRFGFIRRYPPDKAQITGVFNEEMHFRYVGREHALVMQATGWCLEEYLAALKEFGQLAIEQGEKTSYILSCPMTDAGAAFHVPDGYSCTASADNRGYAVCVLVRD